MSTLKQEIKRTIARTNKKSSRSSELPKLYRISILDGKTANDILINIYKDGQISSIINFHADNELQYIMALDIVHNTTLYRTESITALVNRLKQLKSVSFYEI